MITINNIQENKKHPVVADMPAAGCFLAIVHMGCAKAIAGNFLVFHFLIFKCTCFVVADDSSFGIKIIYFKS